MHESLPATWCTIFLSIILICGCCSNNKNKLKTIYSWKALDFAFPNERARETAIREGSFTPGAPVPIDVDFYHKGKEKPIVFVSIPRFQNGVPVTLGYVTDEVSSEGNALIAPYPNWEWNKIGNCDTITSVYRMQVDEYDRLWVLDTGRLGERQVCRPQLLLFSLSNHKLIKQYKFPRNQFKEDSLFVTTAVDVRGECRDTFVYIADVTGFSLIVYDHAKSRSWKITNKLFYPYPPHGTFNISNVSFDLMDGILGLALGPVRPDGDRILYFHSLASNVESWVATSVIRDYERFRDNPEATPRSFKTFNGERSSQSATQVMDKNGILFFGLMSDLAIGCWNSMKFPHYEAKNLDKVVTDPETLQFPSGLKLVLSDSNREELWILTSSFQKYMDGSLRANETNFRIQAGFVDELVRGTKCNVLSRGNSTAPGGPFTFPK